MPSSNLVDLNVDWKSVAGSRIDLGVFVTNLNKEKTCYNATGSWSLLGFESVVTNLPRMFGFRLRYRFGS